MEISVESRSEPSFDTRGRCLPTAVRKAAVHARSRHYFGLGSADPDVSEIHARLQRHLNIEMDEGSFAQRVEALRTRVASTPGLRGMLAGTAVPIALPRMTVVEIGTLMEDCYIPAVAGAFEERFPERRFTNHAKLGLSGKLSVQPGSRHERLLAAQEQGELVGLYVPCLSEYSVPAALEQIAALPDECILAGGFDTSAALIAAPDLLLKHDGYPPLLWLSGLAGEKAGIGYHYEAYGYNLTFNRRAHLDQVCEYWWSGVTVLEGS